MFALEEWARICPQLCGAWVYILPVLASHFLGVSERCIFGHCIAKRYRAACTLPRRMMSHTQRFRVRLLLPLHDRDPALSFS